MGGTKSTGRRRINKEVTCCKNLKSRESTPPLTTKLRKYVNRKIGGLDRYLSKHDRQSAHGEVILRESKSKEH